MQASFTDLVGTAVVPAHGSETHELTDLTPALETAKDVHVMTKHASEVYGTTRCMLTGCF